LEEADKAYNGDGGSGSINERIVIDPAICHGKPVIRGTRTPVTIILGALADGDSFETLQKERHYG
jgi:uncharacterized protein (DUF433 family)